MIGFTRLLAFGFVTPLWLWGLSGIAIPIAIHLWRRQTPRVEHWAAMQFLRAALEQHSRRLRWESLLLLIVRCLALIFLTIAVAEPYLENSDVAVSGTRRTHRILLLDGSLSMSAKLGTQSIFDRARQQAKEVVLQSDVGDTFQLCRIGNSAPPVIIRRAAYDPTDVLREIDRLPLLDDRGDVAGALRGIREILSEVPSGQMTEIYIFSDFQTTNWSGETPSDEAQLRQLLGELASRASLFLVSSGTSAASNVAIHSVQAPDFVALSGQPLRLDVGITSYSSIPETRTLELLANQIVRSSQTVVLAPGSHQSVSASVRIPDSDVPVVIEARIDGDAITVDNQWRRVVASRRSLDLLLVDGHPSESLAESGVGFVQLALSPPVGSESTSHVPPNPFQTTTCVATELAKIDLQKYDCLICSDVTGLDDAQVQRLTEYVEQGGGLIIGLGDRTDREEFQRTISTSLIPVEFLDFADYRDEPATFETRDLSHPVLSPFRGRVDAGFASAPISRYAKIKPRPEGHWQVILPLTNGDPVLLERSQGRGRVVLVTTSLNDRWGHWVIWPSFVPLINRLVEYSLEGRLRFDPVTCGMPIQRFFPHPVTGQVVLPSTKTVDALAESVDSQTVLYWPHTGLSGVYQIAVETPTPTQTSFAVNPDPHESDPRCFDQEAFRRGLLTETAFEWVTAPKAISKRESSSTENRSPLARSMLWVVLALLLAELILAWRFRWGVIALGAISLAGSLLWYAT